MLNFFKNIRIEHLIAIGAYSLGSVVFLSAGVAALMIKDDARFSEPDAFYSNDEYAPILFAVAGLALSISLALAALARYGKSKSSEKDGPNDLASLGDVGVPPLAGFMGMACLTAWAALGVYNHHDELLSETGIEFMVCLVGSALVAAWALYEAKPALKGIALTLFTNDSRSFYDKCNEDKPHAQTSKLM
jgi:hypothetical protein